MATEREMKIKLNHFRFSWGMASIKRDGMESFIEILNVFDAVVVGVIFINTMISLCTFSVPVILHFASWPTPRNCRINEICVVPKWQPTSKFNWNIFFSLFLSRPVPLSSSLDAYLSLSLFPSPSPFRAGCWSSEMVVVDNWPNTNTKSHLSRID